MAKMQPKKAKASQIRVNKKIEALEARLQALEDIEEIKKLVRMYGYYLDKGLWDQIIPLFSNDCSIEISGLGVYLGKKQAETLFKKVLGQGPAKSGKNGLKYGRLFNHLILQGIVHVDPYERTAKGRWRAFIQVAEFNKRAIWGEGPYEMEYVKENGKWKIMKLHFYRTYHTPFDQGWAKAKSTMEGPNKEFPPDLPPSEEYDPYPSVYVPPFHYKNPITGE